MEFPNLYTVWVVRGTGLHLVATERSFEEAKTTGNRVVSNKDFVIKMYNVSDEAPKAPPPVVQAPTAAESFFAPDQKRVIEQETRQEPTTPIDLFKGYEEVSESSED